MKSYSDLKEDLEQRRKEMQSKQKKQIEDRKKKAVSYRDMVNSNMEKEQKRQQNPERKSKRIAKMTTTNMIMVYILFLFNTLI